MRRLDGAMGIGGATAESSLVREGCAADMGQLHDGVSAADCTTVVAAYRSGTLHVVAMTNEVEFWGDARDEVVVPETEREKSAG